MEDLDFYMGDKLLWLITKRLRWSPLRTAFLFSVIFLLIAAMVALAHGMLLPGPNYTALLTDTYYLVTDILLVPVALGYYVWSVSAPVKVLKELEAAGSIKLEDEEIQTGRRLLKTRIPTYGAIVLSAIITAAALYHNLKVRLISGLWLHATLWGLGVCIAMYSLKIYIGIATALRYIVNAIFFRMVLRNVVLHPLHPDRAGGLRPLGRYALFTTYPVALVGSIAAFAEYWIFTHSLGGTSWELHLLCVLYVILGPLVFFGPLWAAHGAMRRAKEDLMIRISKQFTHDFSLTYAELTGSAQSLKDNIEKIRQLQELHRLARSFPVWPFDIVTIGRFLLTMSTPILTVGVSLLGDLLRRLLFP